MPSEELHMIIETKSFDAARARCMSEIEEKALRLAEVAHSGQVDKAGAPYIEHLMRVRDKLVAMFPDATDDRLPVPEARRNFVLKAVSPIGLPEEDL
jgi:(p)ppGpp synthase/HD superfamily hydrolase